MMILNVVRINVLIPAAGTGAYKLIRIHIKGMKS